MAETTQLSFDLKEVATALIKHHGIHEGFWIVAIEFNLIAGNIGPNPDEAMPSAMAVVQKAILVRQESATSKLAVNAAEVNPAKKSESARKVSHKG